MESFFSQSWQNIDKIHQAGSDDLLACLVLLSRYYQNPMTAQALVSRLPIDNHLTLPVFELAAQRAGLTSEKFKCPLNKLKHYEEPVILLLKNNRAVLAIQDNTVGTKILDPRCETLQELEQYHSEYSGSVIISKPTYQPTDDNRKEKKRKIKSWFWPVLFQSWPIYSEVLIASFFVNLFALVVPLFIRNVYDRVVPNYAIETMWVLASGVAIVFVFDLCLKSIRGYFLDLASKKSDTILSAKIFEQILGLKMNDRSKSVGSFVNSVQAYEVFREFISSSTIIVLVDLPFVALFLFVIYIIGGSLFWIPFLVIPIILIMGLLIQYPLVRLTNRSYELAGDKQATLIESISAIEHVKTTCAESKQQHKWESTVNMYASNNVKLKLVSAMSLNITILLQQLATIGVVIYGVYLISDGALTTGGLIACTMLSGRALASMTQVSGLFSRYYQSALAIKSLNNIMQMPTDSEDNMQYLNRPKLKGEVSFQNVSFNYEQDNINQLDHINFNIKAGEKVAIIGPVGSGKSTIARLILRLYQPESGSILLDGTDYLQLNPDELRLQIGYVPQDYSLFYGTVRDNLNVGAPFIPDERILEVAKMAGVTRFTDNHPQGLERQVGERGQLLSGGQRQSIAIARALLLQPNFLVLDEPTSSMDSISEFQLKTQLKKYLTKDKTLLLMTHKMSMLELVDRVIVLDHGHKLLDDAKDIVLEKLKGGVKKNDRGAL